MKLTDDWTVYEGHANCSPLFNEVCNHVERIIRGEARMLIAGNAGAVARLIVAQLAHGYGFAPGGFAPARMRGFLERMISSAGAV